MSAVTKFKVINTTIKPARPDGSGKDLRSAVEKVGHPVQFRDEDDRVHILGPVMNRFAIVDKLNEGIMKLGRGGFVGIEEIKDMATALKEYSYVKRESKAAIQSEAPRRANAVEMGKDDHTSKSGQEHEGAVNPDGDPNFLVKAPRGRRGRPKKAA